MHSRRLFNATSSFYHTYCFVLQRKDMSKENSVGEKNDRKKENSPII